jgi:hypothetical protein
MDRVDIQALSEELVYPLGVVVPDSGEYRVLVLGNGDRGSLPHNREAPHPRALSLRVCIICRGEITPEKVRQRHFPVKFLKYIHITCNYCIQDTAHLSSNQGPSEGHYDIKII